MQTLCKPVTPSCARTVTVTTALAGRARGLPRLSGLAAGRGCERRWLPVRCVIRHPSSAVIGLPRPAGELRQRHGRLSGASSLQHCGRPDPPSGKRPCAGVILFCLQMPCYILGIAGADCSGSHAAAENRPPNPSLTRGRRIPSQTDSEGLTSDSESQSRLALRTGFLPYPPEHACLQTCVALVDGGFGTFLAVFIMTGSSPIRYWFAVLTEV